MEKTTTTETIETRNDLDAYQRHYAERKKPTSKGYTQSDSMCVTFLKWQKYRAEARMSRFQGLGVKAEGKWKAVTVQK